ncbi:hypothetical protein ABT095_32180 [Kitasatospora sp. NPDC002227]|uniref:hypothetical protein n=1 Tax=Kitasatospora sp. NPDC002227 TaxID=3154773 RepID=UPI003328A3B0
MSGQHRGEPHDRLRDVLAALWLLGHAVAIGLLPGLILHHDQAGAAGHARPAATAPDDVPI